MLRVPLHRRARIRVSSSVPLGISRVIGRRIGRASVVLTLTGLLLVAPAALVASASSRPSGGRHCPAVPGHANDGGTTRHAVSEASSTGSAGPILPGTAAPAATDHATGQVSTPPGGKDARHPAANPARAEGSGHHRSGARDRHPPRGASSEGRRPRVGRGGDGIFVDAAIDRVDLRAERDAWVDGVPEVPEAVFPTRPPRTRTPEELAARTIEQITGVLRFPVALLGVIVLFLAFQQRADRGDPKLAHAPVGRRQETLEFR